MEEEEALVGEVEVVGSSLIIEWGLRELKGGRGQVINPRIKKDRVLW